MNKKFINVIIFLVMFTLCLGVKNVSAQTTTLVTDCTTFTTKGQCNAFSKCRWMSGTCQFKNVASEPCNDNNIRKVLKIFGYVLLVAKYVIPLLIIGFGTFDLYKSVIDKDEKSLAKQIKRLGVRILAGLVVFFIPNLVYAIFSLSDKLNIIDTKEYKTCASCVLDPTNNSICSVNE